MAFKREKFMEAKTINIEGFDEPFMNIKAASQLPLSKGENTLREACKTWQKESRQHKAEAARKGLRHVLWNHGFWTQKQWVNDFILRSSK